MNNLELDKAELKAASFGEPLVFESPDRFFRLEVWHEADNKQSWANGFKRVLNGELKSWKTFKGFKHDFDRLVDKFTMEQVCGEL